VPLRYNGNKEHTCVVEEDCPHLGIVLKKHGERHQVGTCLWTQKRLPYCKEEVIYKNMLN